MADRDAVKHSPNADSHVLECRRQAILLRWSALARPSRLVTTRAARGQQKRPVILPGRAKTGSLDPREHDPPTAFDLWRRHDGQAAGCTAKPDPDHPGVSTIGPTPVRDAMPRTCPGTGLASTSHFSGPRQQLAPLTIPGGAHKPIDSQA